MDEQGPAHRAALSTADYGKLTGFDSDWRDTWWSDDFLSMMGREWGLDQVQTILDVGCGVGHWGQRLMRHCGPTTTLYGVDPEQTWVDGARERAEALGIAGRSEFSIGTAESLPWPDNSLDMVTCQTLLIHVANLGEVVAEMTRVVRPGGLFLVAEPNNFGSMAAGCVSDPFKPWSQVSEILELEYICSQGKLAVGEGHQSAGQLVLKGLRDCGWSDVHVRQNSQTATINPPYTDLGSETMIQFMRSCYDSGAAMVLGSTRINCQRYYLAGGGEDAKFDRLWRAARSRLAEQVAAVDAGTYVSSGGHLHYLVWGTKPAEDLDAVPGPGDL